MKIFSICVITDVVKLLRKVKCSLHIVLCRESPYNSINVLGHFSVVLQHEIYTLNLLILLVLVKQLVKSEKYF